MTTFKTVLIRIAALVLTIVLIQVGITSLFLETVWYAIRALPVALVLTAVVVYAAEPKLAVFHHSLSQLTLANLVPTWAVMRAITLPIAGVLGILTLVRKYSPINARSALDDAAEAFNVVTGHPSRLEGWFTARRPREIQD